MQRVLGFSPLQAGLAFLPQTLLIAVGAQVTARLVMRLGPRLLILVGTLVGASGLLWLTRITPASTFAPDLLCPFILIGLGMGLTVTPVTVAGTAGVPRADAGLASGLLNTSRTVGASIGLAVLATLAARRTSDVLGATATTAAHTAAALTDGYSFAILVAAVVLLVAAAVAVATLPSRRTFARGTEEVAPSRTAAPDQGGSPQAAFEEVGSQRD
jgi:MFS family permease